MISGIITLAQNPGTLKTGINIIIKRILDIPETALQIKENFVSPKPLIIPFNDVLRKINGHKSEKYETYIPIS